MTYVYVVEPVVHTQTITISGHIVTDEKNDYPVIEKPDIINFSTKHFIIFVQYTYIATFQLLSSCLGC